MRSRKHIRNWKPEQHWVRLPSSLQGPQHESNSPSRSRGAIPQPGITCSRSSPRTGAVEPCVSGKVRVPASMRSWAVTAGGWCVYSASAHRPSSWAIWPPHRKLKGLPTRGWTDHWTILSCQWMSSFPVHSGSPLSTGVCSKSPSGCLKPQILLNPVCTMFFSIYTSLWWSLTYKLVTVKDERQW